MELPPATVIGYAVNSMNTTGTEGETVPIVVVSFEFQVSPGKVGRQSFMLVEDTAAMLRSGLDNPTQLNPNDQEITQ